MICIAGFERFPSQQTGNSDKLPVKKSKILENKQNRTGGNDAKDQQIGANPAGVSLM